MEKTKFEYVQNPTKRVVVVYDVPVMDVMSDGSEVFSTATALPLDKISDAASKIASRGVVVRGKGIANRISSLTAQSRVN